MIRYSFEQFDAVFARLGKPIAPAGQEPQGESFALPDKIRSGDRHEMLYKLLRSQKARGVGLEGALATCHIENKAKCDPPIPPAELDVYLKRVWDQPDSPTFKHGAFQRDYPLTDRGNAECFVAAYGESLRFDHRRKRFVVLHDETGIWRPDNVEGVRGMATKVIRERQRRSLGVSERSNAATPERLKSGHGR
jgi:hypothetical protein